MGFKFIKYFLFADAEAFEGLGLALDVFEFDGHVEAAFVEVAGRFKVIQVLEVVGNAEIGFEALFDLGLPVEGLSIHEGLFERLQTGGRHVHLHAGPFVQLELLLEGGRGLDVAGGLGLGVRQVKEVDVRLHVATRKQLDAQSLCVDLLVQLETAFVLGEVACAGLVGRVAGLACVLLRAVLFKSVHLGLLNEFVFFLLLGFFNDMADARVRVEDGLEFHI